MSDLMKITRNQIKNKRKKKKTNEYALLNKYSMLSQ